MKTIRLYASVLMVLPALTLAQGASVLEEIVVTAQKREQILQDVPVSVAVISGDLLEELGRSEIADLSRMTPGFSFNDGASDSARSVSIRGVGTQSYSQGLEQTVGTVIDGVVAASVTTSLLDFSDVSRIEVLRGPQGMLFGKNASAGLINIITNNPTEEFDASLRASYAEEDEIKVNGYISGPLGTDALLGRLSFYSNKRDTYIENVHPDGIDYNDRDEWGVRMKLAYEPTDELSTLFSYSHSERDHICCAAVPVEVTPGSRADLTGTPFGEENDKINDNDPSSGSTELDVYSFEINYEMGDYIFTSITSQTDADTEVSFLGIGSPVSFLPLNDAEGDVSQFTQEFRITSPAHQTITYVAGLYYYQNESNTHHARIIDYVGLEKPNLGIPIPGLVGTSVDNVIEVESKSYSAFGQATWHATDALRLSLGARYNNEDIELYHLTGSLPDLGPGFSPENEPGLIEASNKDDAMSWRFIAEYDVAEDAMLYASAARGYKAPATNTLSSTLEGVNSIVDAEIPTSYEIGIKSQWWDNRLRVNASAYYTTFEDFQASGSDGKVPPTFFLTNAGELKTQGFELEVTAQISEQLSVWGGLAYIDAEFYDYKGAQCYGDQTEAEGCIDGVQDLSGSPLPGSPEWSYNIAGKYDIPLSSLPFNGYVLGTYYWQDDILYSGANDPKTIGDSYGIADLTLGIMSKDGRYSVQVFAKNLFDEYWVNRVTTLNVIGLPLVQGIDYAYTRRVGVSAQIWF